MEIRTGINCKYMKAYNFCVKHFDEDPYLTGCYIAPNRGELPRVQRSRVPSCAGPSRSRISVII